jgi:hypothetical protein
VDALLDILGKFFEAIWVATDPFGVAFAIIGTFLLRWFEDVEDPADKRERTPIQRLLPVIPVFLGMSWVIMFELFQSGIIGSVLVVQRALATGCSAIAVHKIWWHTVKNT